MFEFEGSLANLLIERAFIQIETRRRVGPHHEPTGADAGKASGGVDALAAVARVRGLAALVDVLATLPVHQQHVAGRASAGKGSWLDDIKQQLSTGLRNS
jgi:hypothetical protein